MVAYKSAVLLLCITLLILGTVDGKKCRGKKCKTTTKRPTTKPPTTTPRPAPTFEGPCLQKLDGCTYAGEVTGHNNYDSNPSKCYIKFCWCDQTGTTLREVSQEMPCCCERTDEPNPLDEIAKKYIEENFSDMFGGSTGAGLLNLLPGLGGGVPGMTGGPPGGFPGGFPFPGTGGDGDMNLLMAILSAMMGSDVEGQDGNDIMSIITALLGGAGGMPGGIPGMPSIPGMPNIPGMPDIPGMPNIPGMPDGGGGDMTTAMMAILGQLGSINGTGMINQFMMQFMSGGLSMPADLQEFSECIHGAAGGEGEDPDIGAMLECFEGYAGFDGILACMELDLGTLSFEEYYNQLTEEERKDFLDDFEECVHDLVTFIAGP